MWSTLQNKLLQLIFRKKYFCNYSFLQIFFWEVGFFWNSFSSNSNFGNFDFWNCQHHGEWSNCDYDRGSVCITAHIIWDITLFDVTMWVTWSDQMMIIFATFCQLVGILWASCLHKLMKEHYNRLTVKLKNTALLPLVFPFFFSISFKLSLYHCLRRPTSLCQKVFLSFPPSPHPSSWKSIAL